MSIIYEYLCNNDRNNNFTSGVFIFRHKYLALVLTVFLFGCAVVGLIFNLNYGLLIGLSFGLLIFFFFCKWGDKVVLVFARARYVTDDEELINQIRNFCAHIGIKHVAVYWSNVFTNNVYYADSYFGTPAIIIGRTVYNEFSKNEIKSLIYASLLKINCKEARNRTMVALLFLVIFSPLYFARSIIKNRTVKNTLDIFFYPTLALKNRMYEKEIEVINFDQRVGNMEGLKKDYTSALFKLSFLDTQNDKLIGYLVISNLVHVKNRTNDALENVLLEPVDIKKRIKALSVN